MVQHIISLPNGQQSRFQHKLFSEAYELLQITTHYVIA